MVLLALGPTVHELSIATSLVAGVTEAVDRAGETRAIEAVRVRIGALSGVVPDALAFCWPVAAEGTRCAGAELVIELVAGRVWCAACDAETELPEPPRFRCGRCGRPTPKVTAGREMELVSLELADGDPSAKSEGVSCAASNS